MDAQRKVFMSIFNDVSNLQHDAEEKSLLSIIQRLREYADYNLKLSERLLEGCDETEREVQLFQNRLFLKRINAFQQEYEYGNHFLAKNILRFLKKWLVTDMLNANDN